jgi:hypothetical protein
MVSEVRPGIWKIFWARELKSDLVADHRSGGRMQTRTVSNNAVLFLCNGDPTL